MKRICVFCGSSPGARPEYTAMARRLGKALAQNRISLVYGGGSVGLMGTLAQSVVDHGGEVTGVITRKLFKMEVAFTQLSDLRIVNSMHERKAMMADLSDGFIAMPGGFGTMDEIFEALTWTQLNIHAKPCGFLNVAGYYDRLMDFIDHMISQEFVYQEGRSLIRVADDPNALIKAFRSFAPVLADKGAWAKKLAANQ